MKAAYANPASLHVPASVKFGPLVLAALVALVALAAAWWPVTSTPRDEPVAPLPVVAPAPVPMAQGESAVPDASQVKFKADTFEEPTPTF